jgi:hypothetical protein
MTGSGGFPESVDAAVRLLMAMVPDEERARIAALRQEDLVLLHFGLGMWIRNNLGLWQGNTTLLEACGHSNPDDASAFLIEAFWRHLRTIAPKLH